MISLEDAVATLQVAGDAARAAGMRKFHKTPRPYFGVANPVVQEIAKTWRAELSLEDRLRLASELWDSGIHECRIAAAYLLVQARIRPDDGAWALIKSWVPTFDTGAIADLACGAGARRLVADPTRLDEVAGWTGSEHAWTRRAALTMTLPWTKLRNPKPAEIAQRDRILAWAAGYAPDPDRLVQTALADWLAELGRHDAPRVQSFLADHGAAMKPYARKTASRKLPRT